MLFTIRQHLFEICHRCFIDSYIGAIELTWTIQLLKMKQNQRGKSWRNSLMVSWQMAISLMNIVQQCTSWSMRSRLISCWCNRFFSSLSFSLSPFSSLSLSLSLLSSSLPLPLHCHSSPFILLILTLPSPHHLSWKNLRRLCMIMIIIWLLAAFIKPYLEAIWIGNAINSAAEQRRTIIVQYDVK